MTRVFYVVCVWVQMILFEEDSYTGDDDGKDLGVDSKEAVEASTHIG